ncbi:transmembrane protein 214-B isoform X2 [Octopus bimaculoides]|uniref:transmembrane protein 214-B isoform X2 n=1 Tax=Octopus bimaculoides TaxID=37653 RepID=UPI0022E4B885|nr:transmembrane protein 214-B isoform X2 [Octopus bimaculoides]
MSYSLYITHRALRSSSNAGILILNVNHHDAENSASDSTIFEAFWASKKSKAAANNNITNNNNNNKTNNSKMANNVKPKVNDNKKNGNAKKKKTELEVKEKKKTSVEDAINQIDKATLEQILIKDQTTFPDNPEVWLKDLSSYLNVQFEKFPEKDPVFKDKPKDFPLCVLRSDVKKFLLLTLRRSPAVQRELIFRHSINSMLNESAKGLPTYGYRIFIQLLAREEPDLVISKLPQYMELLKSHQNRPLRCSAILWALGQAGFKDLSTGLRIWMELMISSLGFRTITVASYPVDYLEMLFSIHKNVSSAYGVISVKEYFYILDLIYNTNINIQNDLRKKLKVLNAKLKVITYGPNPEKTLRSFFPSYLTRLNSTCSQALKTELLTSLVKCLLKDDHCFSLWQQMYPKHLKQSGILMTYLFENWKRISKEVNQKLLYDTLHSFSVTNMELSVKGSKDPCLSICKDLLQKMTQPQFPWSHVVLLIISCLVSLFFIDVYLGGSFRGSQTVQFLDRFGVLDATLHTWQRIEFYSFKTRVFLKENSIKYYNVAEKTLRPYLLTAWMKTKEFSFYVVDATASQRHWLHVKLLEGKEWLYNASPEFWDQLIDFFWLSLSFLQDYCLWLWQHLTYFSQSFYTFLSTRIAEGDFSVKHIQETLSKALGDIQHVTLTFVQWCSKYLESSTATT